MKPSTLSRSLGVIMAILAPALQAQTLDQGQWNVNNHGTWFNSANWQNGVAPNSVGASAIINQDFGPGRMIADFTQVATMTAAAGTSQQLVTLSKIPVNGSISVTDGTFFWSQGRGASSSAWTVVYNSGLNQIGVTYNPALPIGNTRTLTIAYATADAVDINEVVGAAERIGATDGVATTFSRVLTLFPDEGKIGVTDGTYYWTRTKSGATVSALSSDSNAFSASYDPSSRQITVTYTNTSFAVTGRNIVVVYFPAGTQGVKDLAVNTLASDTPVIFSRELRAEPIQNSSFIIASGGTTWVNGSSSSPTSFDVLFAGPKSVTVTYKAGGTSSLTPLANLAGGPSGLRLITADYATASGSAKNVTLGNLMIGDISGGDRVNLNLNSLTFDTTGGSAQLNKIIGGPDEVAGNVTLNNSLTMAVRTGGDVLNKNIALISANVGGSGSLTKLDSGNVALSGNNTYTGDTFLRNTGGTVFLDAAAGNAISSNDLFLGNASRDGHTSMFLQLSRSNQIADNAVIWFDAASGRNAHFKMNGFTAPSTGANVTETIAGVSDYTGQGVIENTQDEADFNFNSVLTLNSTENFSFNGIIRNKNSGASAGTIGITKTGSGTQTLAGNNIFYSGPTTVTGGTLRLLNIAGQGNQPYNPESQTNGTPTTGSAFSSNDIPRFRSNIANSANVELAATSTWTFGNVISGTGTVTKTGSGLLRVTNNNTYAGATSLANGTLELISGVTGYVTNGFTDYVTAADNNTNLGGSQRNQAIYGHGALASTSAINLSGAALKISNGQDRTMYAPGTTTPTTVVFNNANRVNDSAPINANGGTVTFFHTHATAIAAASYSETLGTLNLIGGRNQVTVSQAATGATSNLTFAGLTRTAGSTINFSGNDIGSNTRNQVSFTNAPALPNGIIGGWATITTINPADNTSQHDFATYANGSVVKLSGYTPTVSGSSVNTTNWTLANNYNLRINGFTGTSNQHTINVSSGSGANNVPRVLNTLKFDDTTAKTINLRTTLARTLILESGGLISRGANHVIGATAAAGQGFLSAGAGSNYELLPWVESGRTLVINAQVANHWNGTVDSVNSTDDIPVRVVKSGPGVLQLFGNNLHTGGTTINQGVVEIDLISGLGPTPALFKQDYLTFNGGTIEAKTPSTGSNEDMIFDDKMGITLGTQGGFFALKNGITTTINSKITGPGGLQMGGGGAGADSAGGVLELSGLNDFTGPLSVITGQLKILGGTNTFGDVSIRGATLRVLDGAAWPTTKPAVAITGGEFDVGGSISIGQLTGAGGISSQSATAAVNLIIDQDSNSTFTGKITESTYALSLEKRGKGTLILNTSDDSAQTSSFKGVVNIVEGVLQANLLNIRDKPSSIGQGNYDASVLTGDGTLEYSEKSASNLIIGNGAALSFAGDFPQRTNRPFTIGVGDLGASLLANSAALGNTIYFYQGDLALPDLTPIGYDTIEFSSPNQGATLNLGGRNQGTNRFAMDLRDNGSAPLSLTKTGDGTWILGELVPYTDIPVVTPSRNTFTGRTTIYLGTLGVQQNGVFGAAGGESVNLIGGNLDLRNVDYSVNEALSMAGGRLRALFGTNAWTGGVSLDVSSVMEVGTDTSLRIRGPIIGKGALIKVGFGTLTLENQNSFTGTMEVQEGTLRLDYTNNKGSKLPDGGALVLGGARQGATLDLVGGNGASIIEIINNMNVRLGLNRITRSDPNATGTIVRLNSLPDFRIAQGAALDFGANNIAQTDRLNNTAGLLGPWATVNKSDWATNVTNSVDGFVAAYTGYVANTWSGVNANVNVTASNTVTDGSIANSLRFNQATSNILTLDGDVTLKSGGVLQTPATGAASNLITGGKIILENNILGGNLMVHQHGSASALTIGAEIANAANPANMTGTIYRDGVNNRFRAPGGGDSASAAAVIASGLYVGMPVQEVFSSPQIMSRLEPGTTISGIDYNNGNISFSQGATADIDVPITITTNTLGAISLQGETMLSGVQNRVRVRATLPGDQDKLKALALALNAGSPISGGSVGTIPVGAIVTSVTLDNKDTPTFAILSISISIPIPAASSFTIRFDSRNGVAKFGDGRLVLSGANTFTGPVFINGGVVSVTEINSGGSPGPLGAGSALASNIQISGGVLEYVGNSVTTDRGFTINELGSVEVARTGAVADFTGNLSGGVGAALGILEKSGEGTLKLTRILGNAESPLPGAPGTQLTQFTPATAGTGGGTNFGGFLVKDGTLKLAYENPNSNENTNRFAASTAALTMAGGRLELVGMDNVNWPGDDDRTNFPVPISSPSENRVQQMLGQLTLSSGGSEIVVTGGSGTTTTLNLQNPSDPKEVIRQPGATVHFVENPQGTNSNVAITLSIPSFFQGTPLPWATYKDTSILNKKGVNDFAAIESFDDGILSADDKSLYVIASDVSQWPSNQPVSEGEQPFFGSTVDMVTSVYLLRFFNKQAGTIDVNGTLILSGGAILVGTNVGDTLKRIQGGVLTSNLYTDASTTDLIIHNYNPSRAFEIASRIDDSTKPVNLVHTGDGTTQLMSDNSYTGSTYLNGGVLRLSSANALPGGIGVSGGISNLVLHGGVLGLESDFTRPLGTGPEAVQFAGAGGFAAYGDTRTVNFGGAGAAVQWGQGGFASRGGSLLLSSYDADATVRLVNPINLGATYRQVDVADGSAAVDAELSGVLSGVGASIGKLGQGTLRLTAANTFTGGTTLAQGTLLLAGAGLGDITVGTVDATTLSDAVTLQFGAGSSVAKLTVGNQNALGISTLKVTGNSTVTNGVELQRDIFVDAAPGRTLNINGDSSGTGRIRVNDGGAVSFNGAGNFGSAGGSQGAAIDGGVVVRNGIVMVGGNSGLGTANIELGDMSSSLAVTSVDRSSAGRSVLERAGEYDAKSSGLPGDVDGTGSFIYEGQSTLTIDGRVYGRNDAAVLGVIGDTGLYVLINGESEHPERNGIYELFYSDGIDPDTSADDIISLRRVTAFDDQDEHDYGARISVLNGTDANKTFFIATNQPDPLPPADFNNRVLIGTPVYWKEEASLNPNVSLLAAAAGLTIPNTVDVNNTNGTGATTLGGGVNFTSGTSIFSGNVQFQGQVPAAETKTVRFTSESLGGRGVEFTGVISEADPLDSLSVVKVGSGTVTFSGENTYKGGTTITSGTLLVNNFSGSGTGAGAVTVSNFGSTLGGIGTIAGATSLLSGAALMPGDPTLAGGVESLLFESSLTLGADSSLWMQWTSELLADELIINGLLTADATAVIKVLLEFVPLNAMTIDLIDWGSISAPGGLADRLDLPGLASSTLFWDTSAFSTTGELSLALRNLSGPPPVHFSIREAAVREGAAAVRIAVELDWEPAAQVIVPIITSGSATVGALADYTLSTTSVTFDVGERSKELVITVRDDPAAEFTEKVLLTIGTPTNAIKGSPTTFTLTVVDNDSGQPLADVWDLRNPLPTNETLTGLASVGTTLVAVGTKGSIFSSSDGVSWTKRPLPVGFALNAVTSDGATFVAVGENGNLVTSTDGLVWVIRSVGGGKTLLDVVWTGTAFVAVGVDGVTYHSDDGMAWTFSTSNLIEDLRAIATSPTQLVAVGEGGVLVTSNDNGITWSTQVSNTPANLSGVVYNGSSLYVAVGDSGVLTTSPDGVNWTAGTTGSSAHLNSVRWDGSLFVAAGSGGTILTSSNGTSWTARVSGVTDGLELAAKLGSQWLAVGDAGTILTSSNATAWARQSSGPTNLLGGVAQAGTQFVAVGAAGRLMTSPDGGVWTQRTSPVVAQFNSVAGSASLIIAVGNGGAAVKSADGVTWTNAVSGVAQNLHDIVRIGGAFYAVGDAGTLLKTTDGVTWNALVPGTIEDLKGIAARTLDDQETTDESDDEILLLAVGSNGAAVMSTDAGATWATVDIGGTASLLDITWTGSTFVAVGGGSNIFTTTDGLVWTKRSAPQLASLTSVAGNATGVLVCGLDGIAFLSTDGGATWQKRDTGTSRSLMGIGVNSAGRFAAVGQVGTILTTEQIAPPPPSVFFTLLNQSVSEETAGVVNVEVNISPASTAKVTVPFTLTSPAGTATAGSTKDYTSSPASPLVFTSGQTSKTISITVKNDNLVEANETVIITLLTPTDDNVLTANPVLAFPAQHTLTIVNVDEVPLITDAPDHAIVALGASHTFNATATGSAPLTLQWQKGMANVAGALGASYTIPSTLITSGGSYRVKASNPVTPAGVFSTAADLVVVDTGYKLTMAKPNATATLTVNYGGPATAFRWFKDNVEITADTADLSGFNKKTLLVKTLTAGEEGFYKCRVTGKGGDLFTGDYEVRVAVTPVITGAPSSFPTGKVGTPYTPYDVLTQHLNLDIHNRPTKWTISGQPTGLSISSTGVISGIPQVSITADTTYNVKVSASNATGVTVSFTAPMTIAKLDANAIGAFVGLVERSGTLAGGTGTLDLGGRLDLTTTSNAKFTGSLTIGTSTATKHPITGLLDTSGANPTATVTIVRTGGKSTLTLSFTLNIGTNLVSGTVTDATPTTAPLNGWRNVWKSTNPNANPASLYDGRHNVMAAIPATLEGDLAHPAIPQGDNCFSIVVDLGGKATVSGKSSDGTVIATTAQVGPSGEVLVYQAMYATTALGSFMGMLDIDTNTAQTVTGDVSWNKPAQVATAANLYRSGFGQVIDLEVAGGLYTPPPTGTIIMAADPGQMTNAGMTFFDVTGLTASPTATNNPNLPAFRLNSLATFVKPVPNPDAHVLTFVTSTGSFSGSFKLTDTASAARTVPYWGLVIPDTTTPSLIDGIGAGYYILKPFTTMPTAAQKSGRVTIVPVLEP